MSEAGTRLVLPDGPGLRRLGRLMRGVGLFGMAAGVAAVLIGLWLLKDIDQVLGRSLVLTAESLGTVDASLEVATAAVATVGDGLTRAERTSRGLEGSLDEGADLLGDTGALLRGDVASSLESVNRSMPALVQVGGTIDATLRAVDQLPVGPTYDPDEPFGETLGALEDDLAGLPGDLREQADTVDRAGENLRQVGGQATQVADAMTDVRASLDDTSAVLAEYRSTAGDARDLIAATSDDLERRLVGLRILVVVLGCIYCVGQVLPLYLGHHLAEARLEALAAPDDVASSPEVDAGVGAGARGPG